MAGVNGAEIDTDRVGGAKSANQAQASRFPNVGYAPL